MLAVAELTMPNSVGAQDDERAARPPGLVRPAGGASTGPTGARSGQRRQRSAGGGAVRLGVHHRLRAGVGGKARYGLGRIGERRGPAQRLFLDVPTLTTWPAAMFTDAWAHPTLDWSIPNIIAHSSDIGTIEMAQRMGMPRFGQVTSTLLASGRGPTSISQVSRPVSCPTPSQWSGTSIATVPIGQGMAVTAVQMFAAYNTIANGGVYIAPRLVDGYVDATGKEHLFPAPPRHQGGQHDGGVTK